MLAGASLVVHRVLNKMGFSMLTRASLVIHGHNVVRLLSHERSWHSAHRQCVGEHFLLLVGGSIVTPGTGHSTSSKVVHLKALVHTRAFQMCFGRILQTVCSPATFNIRTLHHSWHNLGKLIDSNFCSFKPHT
eukprot:Lithocolla_globosa_v1_NODE_1555_length_2489_cov_9.147083.p2 type:complete len:133 gc:universal NODE_1555_length_2489_cov_9.147083:691-1089(+)